LSKNRYTLIITEKPDAALRIATALDEKETPQKMHNKGVPYYIANRDRRIVVVPALGHLYTITDDQKGRGYPVFNYKWVPRYLAEKKATRIRTWLQTITKLSKNADVFIDACDYDIEGSVIGYCILKYACKNKEQSSKRMKFSTLTNQEIQDSYTKVLPHLDFGLIEAGSTRHEVDWLYGINLSRALTTAAKKASGKYTILSTGRVQGPTLKFLADREEAINVFVPTPYWKITALVEVNKQVFEAKHEKEEIQIQKEAEIIVDSCKNKKGYVEKIVVRKFQQPPPFPFDLGTLQKEAYSLIKYTPRRSLDIAQKLYLNALVSYPRTDSQKLPATIGYKNILNKLARLEEYRKHATELLAKQNLKPNEGKKDDPAHPAIYPTGDLPRTDLEPSERKIWDLIIRRFMAVFGDPALKQSVKLTIRIDGQAFTAYGSRVLKSGWMQYYEPYIKQEDVELPSVEKGQSVKVKKVSMEERFTEQPPRYNPSSLLREMERCEIGTKATRADIIQTLHSRGYVEGERMAVTNLGFEILNILDSQCSEVISTNLTRQLETRMVKIQENNEGRQEVLTEVTRILKPILETLKQNENSIGRQLAEVLKEKRFEERTVGPCPVCKSGDLIINYSRKTGKRFIGCTNYFKGICNTSFSLPQKGEVRPSRRRCPDCGMPTVEARIGRRPWILCFNPQCPSKERRQPK
jgi:DNA topoisomerase-1